ncbi:MAG: GntR family transcriptional regulator [Clostridia bacterium]|nr:GntR family transcriptional regulator [Clostridia bacterium]
MKKYEIIEEYILGKIKSGELKHKDKIESVEELCERFEVSHITVQKALTELASRGSIVRVKGSGTFVNCESAENSDKKNIALIIPVNEEFPDSSILTVAKGAKNRADELGYNLMLELCNLTPTSFVSSVESALVKGVGGIAVYVFDVEAAVKAKAKHPELPYVMIDLFDDAVPCAGVTVNNSDGELLAVNHLISKGHRKIGFVGAVLERSTERERYAGYRAAMKAAGLGDYTRLYIGTTDIPEIVEDVRAGKITAICAINDQLSITLIRNLISHGISVPGQCSVVGFDDHDVVQFSPVPLTTVKQNFTDLGICAVDLLDEQIRGSIYHYRKIYSPVRLIERESVAELK